MTQAYAAADADRTRAEMRDALSLDDTYQLFLFGTRQAVFALRDCDESRIVDGAVSAAMLEPRRMFDWRKATVSLGHLYYAGLRIGAGIDAIVRRAAKFAGDEQQKNMFALADSPHELESFEVAEVTTGHGIGLVRRSSFSWKPDGDVAQLAATIAEIVNHDRYQIEDVQIASLLLPVWLRGPEKDVKPLLDRVRACSTIYARMRPAADVPAEDGLGLLIWVVQFEDAQTAEAVRAIGTSRDESIVIQDGTLFCIISPRSQMPGTAFVDKAAALERFRDRVQRELRLLAR